MLTRSIESGSANGKRLARAAAGPGLRREKSPADRETAFGERVIGAGFSPRREPLSQPPAAPPRVGFRPPSSLSASTWRSPRAFPPTPPPTMSSLASAVAARAPVAPRVTSAPSSSRSAIRASRGVRVGGARVRRTAARAAAEDDAEAEDDGTRNSESGLFMRRITPEEEEAEADAWGRRGRL